jgi:hypothetical protein
MREIGGGAIERRGKSFPRETKGEEKLLLHAWN